jgi:hypothetical protein
MEHSMPQNFTSTIYNIYIDHLIKELINILLNLQQLELKKINKNL